MLEALGVSDNTSVATVNSISGEVIAVSAGTANIVYKVTSSGACPDSASSFAVTVSSPPQTYVPDDNFEAYLETHDASGNVVAIGASNSMGNGITNDDSVTTANVSGVTNLDVNSQ